MSDDLILQAITSIYVKTAALRLGPRIAALAYARHRRNRCLPSV
jgi:hypothetical protein